MKFLIALFLSSSVAFAGTNYIESISISGGSPSAGKIWTAQNSSGDGAWGTAAASSQTPWVTNIDAANFSITNLGNAWIGHEFSQFLFVGTLTVTNNSTLGEVTLNGLTHSATNAATEGFVTNYVSSNYVQVVVNTNAFDQSANISTTTLYTSPSTNMYEISGAITWTVIPSVITNTLTIAWADDAGATNIVKVIDTQTRLSVGQMGFGPMVIVSKNAKDITYATTMGGITGSHKYQLRLTLKKLQ